jgi:hypothetical protein
VCFTTHAPRPTSPLSAVRKVQILNATTTKHRTRFIQIVYVCQLCVVKLWLPCSYTAVFTVVTLLLHYCSIVGMRVCVCVCVCACVCVCVCVTSVASPSFSSSKIRFFCSMVPCLIKCCMLRETWCLPDTSCTLPAIPSMISDILFTLSGDEGGP